MDAYRTPASGLHTENQRVSKPISGILIGLCFTILLTTLTSSIMAVVFAASLDAGVTIENLNSEIAKNSIYLLADLAVSSIVIFFAGRAIGKRTPGKEIHYGIILSVITLLIYLPMFWYTNALITYPIWYNLLVLFSLFLILPLGAKTAAHT